MHSYSADFSHLISVYVLILLAPGLDFAVVLRESLLYGRGNGVSAALGVMCAVIIHCTYTILGLGLVIAQSLLLFNLIKWAGIAYLLYIGGKALLAQPPRPALSAGTEQEEQGADAAGKQELFHAGRDGKPRRRRQSFLAGFACNLLNPKCILFFLSLFSALIAPDTPLAVKGVYGVIMVLCCGLWFSCVAVFLTMPKIIRLYKRMGRWIDKLTGAVFIILGISLIFQKGQA